MAVENIRKLQRANSKSISDFLDSLDSNTANNRGENNGVDSKIEQILYDWADKFIIDVKESLESKRFNTKGELYAGIQPYVVDRAGVLKALQIVMPDSWVWAERGRKKGKRPPVEPIERWITYRGIDVNKVKNWERKITDKEGHTRLIKPYKNISNTLKLRNIMAEAMSSSIGKHGTLKRFGGKGSKFLSEVVNKTKYDDLSKELSIALGYQVAVGMAQSIEELAQDKASQIWKSHYK